MDIHGRVHGSIHCHPVEKMAYMWHTCSIYVAYMLNIFSICLYMPNMYMEAYICSSLDQYGTIISAKGNVRF